MEIDDDMVMESFSPTTQEMIASLDETVDDAALRLELMETRREQLARGLI